MKKYLSVTNSNDFASNLIVLMTPNSYQKKIYNGITLYQLEVKIDRSKCLMLVMTINKYLSVLRYEPEDHIAAFDEPIKTYLRNNNEMKVLRHLAKQCSRVIIWSDGGLEKHYMAWEIDQACKKICDIPVYLAEYDDVTLDCLWKALMKSARYKERIAKALQIQREIYFRLESAFKMYGKTELHSLLPAEDVKHMLSLDLEKLKQAEPLLSTLKQHLHQVTQNLEHRKTILDWQLNHYKEAYLEMIAKYEEDVNSAVDDFLSFKNSLDNDEGTFRPGDTIQAQLVLEVKEYASITDLCVRIKGLAKCHWTEDQQTFYHAKEICHQDQINFVNDGNILELNIGKFTKQISFNLPSKLPTSFKGKHGTINYILTATATCFPCVEYEDMLKFSIQNWDENIHKSLHNKYFSKTESKEPISISSSLLRDIYVAEENINIQTVLTNQSGINIKSVKIYLQRNTTYYGDSSGDGDILEGKKEIEYLDEITETNVGNSEREQLVNVLKVPNLCFPNLQNCTIIEVKYFVKIEVEFQGTFIELKIPINLVNQYQDTTCIETGINIMEPEVIIKTEPNNSEMIKIRPIYDLMDHNNEYLQATSNDNLVLPSTSSTKEHEECNLINFTEATSKNSKKNQKSSIRRSIFNKNITKYLLELGKEFEMVKNVKVEVLWKTVTEKINRRHDKQFLKEQCKDKWIKLCRNYFMYKNRKPTSELTLQPPPKFISMYLLELEEIFTNTSPAERDSFLGSKNKKKVEKLINSQSPLRTKKKIKSTSKNVVLKKNKKAKLTLKLNNNDAATLRAIVAYLQMSKINVFSEPFSDPKCFKNL